MNAIRGIAKKVIPRDAVWRFRLMRPGMPYRKLLNELESARRLEADFIIGTPLHDNLGDHLITLGERCFLEDGLAEREAKEIPLEFFRLFPDAIEKAVNDESRIFINGGGWMGDVWPEDERAIQNVVELFPNNRIVIFPQTIYYEHECEESEALKKRGVELYDGHAHLTMFLRERNSYDLATDLYQDADTRLAPDIALYYRERAPKRRAATKIAGLCLRDDKELADERCLVDDTVKWITESGIETKRVSTISKRKVSESLRESAVQNVLREFSNCGVVVTDRLHAMICCFITDTPCVVFDNKTKKVSGVYNEWLSASESILPVFDGRFDLSDIREFIEESLGTVYFNEFSESNFSELRSVL